MSYSPIKIKKRKSVMMRRGQGRGWGRKRTVLVPAELSAERHRLPTLRVRLTE